MKKHPKRLTPLSSLGAALALTLGLAAPAAAAAAMPEVGDFDGDGRITTTDARCVLQASVGKLGGSRGVEDLTPEEFYLADADGDGKVTSTDARLILQAAVGKIPGFPERAVAYSENDLEFIGRFGEGESGKYFDWSGSAVTAGFQGTGIGVRLTASAENSERADYFNVYIDDRPPYVLTVTPDQEEYTLAEDLPPAHHTVKLVKRTEAAFGMLICFKGFIYPEGTGPAAAPARAEKSILFLGDSITAGYGNEGVGSGFVLSQENASLTFGSLTAEALGMEATLVARSGVGLHISLGGEKDKTVGDYFDKTLYHTATVTNRRTSETPSIIVLNIGTNDYAVGVGDGDFYTDCLAFVKTLRRTFPGAAVILMTGGGQDKQLYIFEKVAADIRSQYPSARIGVFESSLKIYTCEPEDLGRDGHPSVIGHRKMARELTEFIRQKGWQ